MNLQPSLFKAYDIRGAYPQEVNEAFACALGLAFGAAVLAAGERTVALGRDGRLSSPALAAALEQGLLATGLEVLNLGAVTTPMLYFGATLMCRSGIQVTGSHNPRDENGFKMVLAGQTLQGEGIQALHRAMAAGNGTPLRAGFRRGVDILPAYRERLLRGVHLTRPVPVVVDCGHGVAGASAPELLRALGCPVVALYSEVDGHFPRHHPDPSRPENLQDLIAAVRAHGAELGLAFDGDGDRLGVVTPQGEIVDTDRLLILFAREVLRHAPGAPVVFDVKCSQRLPQAITQAGGVPVMAPSGHSRIKARMREVGAVLGGEVSGHLYFQDRWYGFDDGTYAAARLLELLSRAARSSEVLRALPKGCITPELHLPCDPRQAADGMARLQARAHFEAPATVSTVDGVRVDWPDGFGLVRASNTSPVLTLRFEGQHPEALARIRHTVEQWLRQEWPELALPLPPGEDQAAPSTP